MADDMGFEDAGTLVLEQRFAIVPEWVIDAPIGDCAFRLYAVLLRYGQTSGQRMPGRALLARRLHKGSKDTVDRALKELVAVGAVVIERRRNGTVNLTNRYHVRTTAPLPTSPETGGRRDAATPSDAPGTPGRTDAATLVQPLGDPPGRSDAATSGGVEPDDGGRTVAATPGRTDAARVAAPMRPDPEVLTQREPPPSPPAATVPVDNPADPGPRTGPSLSEGDQAFLAGCGIPDLDALARQCQDLRRRLGQPAARWAPARLLPVLRDAVTVKGWPARCAAPALLTVAADALTKSPSRLSCPGPWWDRAESRQNTLSREEVVELDWLEIRLREADGRRVWAQQRARADLAARGQDVTRLTMARRACQLLDEAELTPC